MWARPGESSPIPSCVPPPQCLRLLPTAHPEAPTHRPHSRRRLRQMPSCRAKHKGETDHRQNRNRHPELSRCRNRFKTLLHRNPVGERLRVRRRDHRSIGHRIGKRNPKLHNPGTPSCAARSSRAVASIVGKPAVRNGQSSFRFSARAVAKAWVRRFTEIRSSISKASPQLYSMGDLFTTPLQ